MNRVEELSARAADGVISDDERRELDALLADNPEARGVFLLQLETEAALRRRRRDVDVSGAVMERLDRAQEDRVVSGVMAFARKTPRPAAWAAPAPAQPPRRGVWVGPLVVAAAAGVLAVVAGIAVRRARQTELAAGRGVPALTPVLAMVIEARDATLDRAVAAAGGRGLAAQPGTQVHAGDRVEVSSGGSLALTYQGTTRLDLGEATKARLAGAGAEAGARENAGAGAGAAGGAQAHVIEIDRGTLKANVGSAAGRGTLMFVTPHARATVRGTRFTLTVTPAFTRLDVAEGRVSFERLFEPESSTVEVGKGEHALGFGDRRALALLAPPPPAEPTPARTVLSFDFEDGALPEDFAGGHTVPGPPRAGNRYCLIGSVDAYMMRATSIEVERVKGLMSYNSRYVLTFDYWVGADAEELMVQVWAPDLKQNFFIASSQVVREQWGHAELRLADLKSRRNPGHTLRDGERLANIMIFGGRTAGKPLYVDNLRVVEHAAETIPQVSNFRSGQ